MTFSVGDAVKKQTNKQESHYLKLDANNWSTLSTWQVLPAFIAPLAGGSPDNEGLPRGGWVESWGACRERCREAWGEPCIGEPCCGDLCGDLCWAKPGVVNPVVVRSAVSFYHCQTDCAERKRSFQKFKQQPTHENL